MTGVVRLTNDAPAQVALVATDITDDRWLLLFGGTTTAGAKRASRLCSTALERGLSVIWFDGHGMVEGEAIHQSAKGDHPLAINFDYTRPGHDRGWARYMTESTQPSGRARAAFWRLAGRRLHNLLRPYAAWRFLRKTLSGLSSAPPPAVIAFCDDSALPLAWHSARRWPFARVVTRADEL